MNRLSFFALWLSALPLLAAPGVETFFQPVALAGLSAPGATNNNVKFLRFEDVSLADDGRIAFTGRLIGPGVTSTNGQGLWAGLPSDLRLVARTGDPMPGCTNCGTIQYLRKPNIDEEKAVGFQVIDDKALSIYKGTLVLGELSFFDPRFNGGILPIGLSDHGDFNENWEEFYGHVVNTLAGRVELSGPGIGPTNNLAIVAGPPTNVVIVARNGSPAPGVAGDFTFFPNDSQVMALTPDGNVAFRGQATDGPATRYGLWFGKAGTVQLVAFQNRPAPASLLGPGYTFGFMPSSGAVEVNARGELAFAANLDGPGLNSTNSAFVIVGPPGGLRVVVQSGQPAPGIPGAVFADFQNVLLGTDGTAAFRARFTTNGTDLVFGLWLAPTNGAPPILLMHAGQRAPGTPADVYFKSSFADEAYFMNSRNQVVFRSLLTGPGLDFFDKGIWLAEPDGTVSLIVRKGDMVDTGGGVMAKVANVSFGVDPEFTAGPEDGRRTPFNNRGEVALQIYFDAPPPPLTSDGGIFIARTGLNLSAAKSGTDLHLSFPTLTGKHYRVDYKTNLADTAWSVLAASVDGTGAQVTVTNSIAVASQARFYRVVRTD